ncbi:MAG: UrcA family protein [Steroidobacteraceae bacterium]|jgi:UrcA family protein
MNNKASITRASWLVYSAFGCAFGANVVMAQQAADVVVQADRPEITVKMPVRGSVVKEVSLAQHVSYGDLDLTTPAGAAELEKRVTAAAEAVCKKLGKVYPDSRPKGHSCTEITVKDAMHKVRGTSIAAVR